MGAGVELADIYCSSIAGFNTANGAYFVDDILRHLNDADIIISLLSPSYANSRFCLAEAGAASLRSLIHKTAHFVSLLVKPSVFADFKEGVFLGLQAGNIDDGDALDEMRDTIMEYIEKKVKTSIWNKQRSVFLRAMESYNREKAYETAIENVSIEKVGFSRTEDKRITYKSKVYIEMKNETGYDIRVRVTNWSGARLQNPPVQKSVLHVWQADNKWSHETAEILVHKGQLFSAWVGLDPRQSSKDLRRMRENQRLGTLELLVSIEGYDFPLVKHL